MKRKEKPPRRTETAGSSIDYTRQPPRWLRNGEVVEVNISSVNLFV